MQDSIIREKEDGEIEEFTGGKAFVEAVAKASSKEELRRILNAGGVDSFSEEELEESWRNIALSQDWDAVRELFEDKDYESCSQKLARYGITTTKEHFALSSIAGLALGISGVADPALLIAIAGGVSLMFGETQE